MAKKGRKKNDLFDEVMEYSKGKKKDDKKAIFKEHVTDEKKI